MGRDDLIDDERFRTTPERIANMPEFVALLDAEFARRDFEDWSERFTHHEIPYSLVSNLDDIANDEQLEAIGMFRDLDHPEYGRLRTVDSPVFVEGEDKAQPQPAPALGEHTGELLRELGLDASEIADLADQGVISGRL
ncbi:MAG: CoA transferase [Holophagales bacterium]|nr:CoA transferase [Holophagales bacterium]